MPKEVAIVTGGARGIGFGIARALGKQGFTIALFDLDEAALGEAVTKLRGEEIDCHPYRVNVTRRGEVDDGVAAAQRDIGDIAVLVNNAGITRDKRLVKMEEG